MAYYYGKLCSVILSHHFGSNVQKVADILLKNGPQKLSFIYMMSAGLPLDKVKESLCVLLKFGLVVYMKNEKGLQYKLEPDKIIAILRYPRFMLFVKNCNGDEGEIILEETLKCGYETASQLILKTYVRLQQSPVIHETSIELLKEKFQLLVKNQFLIRYTMPDEQGNHKIDNSSYDMPELDVNELTRMINGHDGEPGDNKIYWKINIDRLTQDLRDNIIIEAVSRMVDDNAKELMRQMIFLMYERTASWSDTSNPIPFHEIKTQIKKLELPKLSQYLDQYLQILVDDPAQFLKRVGDSGGGQFSIDIKRAFEELAWATIANIICERFGSKAARIFRLIRMKKYIDQEEIQQLSLIPAREAKHLTYALLEENYLKTQELKKASVASGPSKVFFVFHIDLNQVVRMQVERCCQALYNIMQRREDETISNKRMMDKQLRIQTLMSNLQERGGSEEQLLEIETSMTPLEKAQLGKAHKVIKTLSGAELQIDETLFLLTMYLRYH
ncbi:hypothetical protein PV325_014103 [Microctonus aethiopoides]|uniref:DNA-directed RNA polymerase III subunit RPC3 n=1 Tax=Microctonus aethiopoides TaxID=144406 RepID=A0AA39KKM6_9HYME|nr:hypothetical protein PV325_014103 [Microctonus aethiopoides]KAK0094836.1 hypothetical protein PV326_009851 [Microctonus aethiopoides]KAK0164980.1 hypothetical protein PV328_003542 [Microctonus aethiopoides]